MASKDAGFTLIDALAVVAILAISLTLGLPALSGTLERQRLATSLHLVSADLAMARSSAIMRREQVVVCPGQPGAGCSNDHDWSRGWLVFRDPDGNRQPDAPDDLLRASQAPAGGVGSQLRGKVVVNRLGRVRTERPTRETACP